MSEVSNALDVLALTPLLIPGAAARVLAHRYCKGQRNLAALINRLFFFVYHHVHVYSFERCRLLILNLFSNFDIHPPFFSTNTEGSLRYDLVIVDFSPQLLLSEIWTESRSLLLIMPWRRDVQLYWPRQNQLSNTVVKGYDHE